MAEPISKTTETITIPMPAANFLDEILKSLCVTLPETCGTRTLLLSFIKRRDLDIARASQDELDEAECEAAAEALRKWETKDATI